METITIDAKKLVEALEGLNLDKALPVLKEKTLTLEEANRLATGYGPKAIALLSSANTFNWFSKECLSAAKKKLDSRRDPFIIRD